MKLKTNLNKFVSSMFFVILITTMLLVNSDTFTSENVFTIQSERVFVTNTPILFDDSNIVNLTIFLVSDLHGWIQPHDGYGGVATLMGHFIQDGYSSDNDSFLIFSGGDHNTGPAEATLSKGEAVIDVLNAMNFSAVAIGNHEFDYGVEVMELQKEQANFPLLASNIFDEGTTTIANFSVPYVIQEHAGIKVGIIGLTLDYLYAKMDQDYDAGEYETSLMLYLAEELVDMSKATSQDKLTYFSKFYPDKVFWSTWDIQESKTGIYGDPTVASKETGKRIMEATVENYVEFIREFHNFQPKK